MSISLDAMAAAGEHEEVDAALKGASRDGVMSAEAMLEAMREGKHELVRHCLLPHRRQTETKRI